MKHWRPFTKISETSLNQPLLDCFLIKNYWLFYSNKQLLNKGCLFQIFAKNVSEK